MDTHPCMCTRRPARHVTSTRRTVSENKKNPIKSIIIPRVGNNEDVENIIAEDFNPFSTKTHFHIHCGHYSAI
ncbi:hypothetical protein E2C01_038527 [Portunus trituberculatus]|uniref:Uncharacterized protein n=1 Tax=Portunus trituberculatus TaxID=210409 RepID=A0A5B7FHF8_PORTR|nr:hypothetical protein [Portunus trituberculatus]